MLRIDINYPWQSIRSRNRLSVDRRLKLGLVVVTSQLLLISLAIAWLVHMLLIAVNGSIYFVERNPFILWGEIMLMLFITMFATGVLVIQLKGLDERRRSEDRDGQG